MNLPSRNLLQFEDFRKMKMLAWSHMYMFGSNGQCPDVLVGFLLGLCYVLVLNFSVMYGRK